MRSLPRVKPINVFVVCAQTRVRRRPTRRVKAPSRARAEHAHALSTYVGRWRRLRRTRLSRSAQLESYMPVVVHRKPPFTKLQAFRDSLPGSGDVCGDGRCRFSCTLHARPLEHNMLAPRRGHRDDPARIHKVARQI